MSDQNTLETENPSLEHVMGILTGYWQAKILLAAADSDLFTVLSDAPATAEEVGERVGFRMPGAEGLLLALCGMGILEAGEDGKFRNSAVSDQFLVRGRPAYIGGYLQFCAQELNPAWDGLGAALRTGIPQNPAARSGNPYDVLYADREAAHSFLESMDMLNTPLLHRLSALDWSRYGSFVDVGGARGNVAHHLVGEHSHLQGGVFDFPPLEEAFASYTASVGRKDTKAEIAFHGGDFFKDPLPEADVLIFGHVLHNWSTEDRRMLLRNAYSSVRPGGAVVIYDPMVSNSRPPLYATLAALSMLVWSAGGGEYAVGACHSWLREAGFRPETVGPEDTPDDVLVIGHKDS